MTTTPNAPARGWNTMPAEELPLRPTLPRMRPETMDKLTLWALRQNDVMPWVYKRTAAYWHKLSESRTGPLEESVAGLNPDQRHRLIDAVAALDLLKWQIDQGTDKEAVQQLDTFETVANQ